MLQLLRRELLFAYLILSPISWTPVTPPSILFAVKAVHLVVLVLLFFTEILAYYTRSSFSRTAVLAGMLIAVCSSYAVIVYESGIPYIFFHSYFVLLFLIAGNSYSRYDQKIEMGVFSSMCAVVTISLLCFVVAAIFIPGLDFNNPYVDVRGMWGAGLAVKFSTTGYNYGRTGWVVSLALLVGHCLFVFVNSNKLISKAILIVLILLASVSMLFSTSRLALIFLVMLIIPVLVIILKSKGKGGAPRFARKLVLSTLILALSIYGLLYIIQNVEVSRVDTLLSGDSDVITNGRAEGLSYAFNIWMENFWVGSFPYGIYDLTRLGFPYPYVHLGWLHLAASYGVIVAFSWIAVTGLLVLSAFRVIRRNKSSMESRLPILFVIVTGIISTLTEPEAILMFAPYSAIFWFWLGYVQNAGRISERIASRSAICAAS